MTTAQVARPSALASLALSIAQGHVGVMEQTPYTGHKINTYLRSVNLVPGNYWGWAFVYYIYRQASLTLELKAPPLSMGAIEFWNKCSKSAQIINIHEPPFVNATKPYQIIEAGSDSIGHAYFKKGDLYYTCSNGVWHCGIVESVNQSGNLYGIEGCTVANSATNKIGVAVKRRRIEQVRKLLRLTNLYQ